MENATILLEIKYFISNWWDGLSFFEKFITEIRSGLPSEQENAYKIKNIYKLHIYQLQVNYTKGQKKGELGVARFANFYLNLSKVLHSSAVLKQREQTKSNRQNLVTDDKLNA